jgi:hypothetical protein
MSMRITSSTFGRDRLRACALHLLISLGVAALSALLVFGIWYPYPYRDISSGRELFFIVVAVDVILGPLITLVVFNRSKPWAELRIDLTFVGLLQLSALAYGLWTVAIARPVHMVFEIDRFRVVHAIEIDPELLPRAPAGINALPLTGPTMLGLRPFKNSQENTDATLAALQGVQLGARPDLWQTYEQSVPDILKAAKPVGTLKHRFATQAQEIDSVLLNAGRTEQDTLYVPLVGRKSFWTVFLDSKTAQVVATLPLDSF